MKKVLVIAMIGVIMLLSAGCSLGSNQSGAEVGGDSKVTDDLAVEELLRALGVTDDEQIKTIAALPELAGVSKKQDGEGAVLTMIGHASMKIKSKRGTVVYIDPAYEQGDYSEPADAILITHLHRDHNRPELCEKKENCQVITYKQAQVEGEYLSFDIEDIHVEAVPSGGNSNHAVEVNVGYIVTVDDVKVYHAGDTSMYDGLKKIVGKDIDYAFYPCDGVYNMGPEEATEVADMIGAKHNIPMHGDDKNSIEQFMTFHPANKMVVIYGQAIDL